MKSLLSIIFCLGLFATSFAQNVNDEVEIIRDMAAAERRALVAENLMLTEAQSKLFWPMYDDYRAEARKLGTREIEAIEKFAANYENMSDDVAVELMAEVYKIAADQAKLKSSVSTKMSKTLPPKLVLRYMQIENKMDAMVEFDLAMEIPLIISDK